MIEARSRIQALQARIRPHLLLNSMNTIASLKHTSYELIEKAVENLADLFRASLGHQNYIKLDEALEFTTHRYINIEELRLGDRLQLDWLIEDNVDTDPKMLTLILQSFFRRIRNISTVRHRNGDMLIEDAVKNLNRI